MIVYKMTRVVLCKTLKAMGSLDLSRVQSIMVSGEGCNRVSSTLWEIILASRGGEQEQKPEDTSEKTLGRQCWWVMMVVWAKEESISL